jgi:hypothetical protein
MPDRIDRAVERWLTSLDDGWGGAVDDLAQGHARVLGRVARTLAGLEADIALAVANEVEVSASWLFQRDRYRVLQGQVVAAIEQTALQVAELTPVLRQQGIETGIEYADEVFRVANPQLAGVETFGRLPREAIMAQVGFLQTDPLRAVAASIDPLAGWGVLRDRLVSGIGTGQSFRSVARDLLNSLSGLTLTRAMTITRTEMNRSYREGARLRWGQNPVVDRWVWRAAIAGSRRGPCPVCLGKHGTIYPKSERMSSHPNCRCAPVPLMPSQEPPPGLTPGAAEEYVRGLSERERVSVLGRTRAREWEAGNLPLQRMVEDRIDPTWGVQPRLIRLRDLQVQGVVTGRTTP